MRSIAGERVDPAEWDVARPARPSRVAGVTMAGFGVRTAAAIRIVPHPAVMLVLMFGACRAVLDDATGRRQLGSVVAGPGFGSGGMACAHGMYAECVQVRLSPAVARGVLGASPAELDGTVVPLDDLWGADVARIQERLGEVSSWDERFALTDALLARRCEARRSVDPEVAWAWDRMVAGRGVVRIDGLATEVGWSRKRLWSRFRSQAGLTPKLAAKLVRFDHAAHRLVAGEGAARVAAEGGYADQSHLHRDVVAFSGTTPATVADEPFLTVDDRAWAWHRGRPPTVVRHGH